MLLANGAQVNACDYRSSTPLHYAAWDNNIEVAKVLLANGASVDFGDEYNDTPLTVARGRGAERRDGARVGQPHLEMEALLWEHGELERLIGLFGDVRGREEFEQRRMLHLAHAKLQACAQQ